MMDRQKLLVVALVIFLLCDATYSFFEYYFARLDGDIASGVLPSADVQTILDDPLGFNMLSTGKNHVNPNRFFSHVLFKEYMQKVPVWLQSFFNPITSVYISAAILKLVLHLLVIVILSLLITGSSTLWDKQFLIVAALITPLIQANGYWGHMAINDKAITYCFFYSLPVVALMVAFFPLFRILLMGTSSKPRIQTLIIPLILAVLLPLSGPLIPGIVLIVSLLIAISNFIKERYEFDGSLLSQTIGYFRRVPFVFYLFLIPSSIVSVYSLFLGLFDINFSGDSIPIIERYMRLPQGIFNQFSKSVGFGMLVILLIVNYILIKKNASVQDWKRYKGYLKWIGIFAVVYIILLPLGGYRPYRPFIIRYDTFMPVTITFLFLYGSSSYFLIRNLKLNGRKIYLTCLMVVLGVFTIADHIKTENYRLERESLENMSVATDSIIALPKNSRVMTWETISDPAQSELNARLIYFWGITSEVKLYYNENK